MQSYNYPTYDFGFQVEPMYNVPISMPSLDLGAGLQAVGDFVMEEERILVSGSVDALLVTLNFLEGWVKRNNLTEMEKCSSDLTGLESKIMDIVEEIKSLNPLKIVDAVKKMVAVVQEFSGDLQQCENTQDDVQKCLAWAKNVASHPTDIVNHVLANMDAIVAEISKTITDFNGSDYATTGDDLAELMVDVFGTVDDKYTGESINWDLIF